MADLGQALDWGDEIEKESSFVLFDEGDYDFTILNYERGRFEGSDKMAPAPKATVTFEITDGKQTAQLTSDFILNTKMEWKLSQLFKSVGLKGDGERVPMQWNKLAGSTGRLKVVHVQGTKDPSKTFMSVGELYAKSAKPFKAGEF